MVKVDLIEEKRGARIGEPDFDPTQDLSFYCKRCGEWIVSISQTNSRDVIDDLKKIFAREHICLGVPSRPEGKK